MVDLSSDNLSPEDAQLVNLGIEEQAHRIGLQRSAFSIAMSFAAILLMAAVSIAWVCLHLYATKDRFDWHAALLIGAFIVPMTVIVIGALRAAFQKQEADKPEGLPSWEVAKDLIKEVAGAFKGSEK